MAGKRLSEGAEPPIGIDVIDNEHAACSEGRPSSIQLEAYVAFSVEAVVNEKIDLAKSTKQFPKASPTRTPHVCPLIWVPVANCRADLLAPISLQRRKVNTPEVTLSVSSKRLENKTRSDTVSDPRLNNLLWF